MKPLLKWPGGKARELEQLTGLVPDFDRYIEPFFGGGALFFALQPKSSAINDISRDLMEFYHLVRTQNPEFRQCLNSYAESFQGLQNFAHCHEDDLLDLFRRKGQQVRRRTSPQVVNFKKAQKEVQERKGYLHKCAVCGITDADDPDMEFRYCSKCNGYYCYCQDHINDHVHIQ